MWNVPHSQVNKLLLDDLVRLSMHSLPTVWSCDSNYNNKKTQAVTFLTYTQLRQSAQRTLHTALRHLSKVRFSLLLQMLREFVTYMPAVETRSCQPRHRDANQ